VVYGALIFRRVLFEDAFLQANLAGYREYVQRVRYRLVPGVW
jgi:protein-S-isoprenylcysteine O-methyltransferase Ste14